MIRDHVKISRSETEAASSAFKLITRDKLDKNGSIIRQERGRIQRNGGGRFRSSASRLNCCPNWVSERKSDPPESGSDFDDSQVLTDFKNDDCHTFELK
ncbi:hypothetical protein EVAR_57254_1 [Eumeta japonica]|uniref:Uncharacterized protein n=1 Tax=Eumeta variegata TaxID=151549 RepID=A0A4C1ZWE0_EUMVA|nr:hypothetical protein EVAR_57254_1 [Eumeta japonica]